LAAVNATITSTNVLALGFAFGPSQRTAIPLVVRPLLTSPPRAAASRPRPSTTFDRCAPKDGIEPFDALVEQFMNQAPYSKAPRVFLIVDNGSAHRRTASINRRQGAWPNLIVVHTPVHASWLNQAEIYFSIAQRKVLQPNNFADLDALEQALLAFGRRYEQIAKPFEWKFTRRDLDRVLDRLEPTAEARPTQQAARPAAIRHDGPTPKNFPASDSALNERRLQTPRIYERDHLAGSF
jgi:DDE superfamily endonuclease